MDGMGGCIIQRHILLECLVDDGDLLGGDGECRWLVVSRFWVANKGRGVYMRMYTDDRTLETCNGPSNYSKKPPSLSSSGCSAS